MNNKKKLFWKNIIALGVFSVILFSVFVFNLRIGFSVFDWSEATISGMFILSAFIALLSVPLLVFIIFYRKKKK